MTLYSLPWNSFCYWIVQLWQCYLYLCAFAILFLHSKHTIVMSPFWSPFWAPQKCRSLLPLDLTALCKSMYTVSLIPIFKYVFMYSPLLYCDLLEGKGALLINHRPSAWHMKHTLNVKNKWFNQLLLIPLYLITALLHLLTESVAK